MKEIKTHRDLMKVLSEGHTVESKYENGENWITVESFTFYINNLDNELLNVYRIKPTKPSIDWSQVSDEFNYLARNENGKTYLYENKPEVIDCFDQWTVDGGDFAVVKAFKSLDAGNCRWDESLVKRPNNEDEEQK